MHVCNCRPEGYGLPAGKFVDTIAEGASNTREIVAKTGAGTNCHRCVPRLNSLRPVVDELVKERDAARPAMWPNGEQRVRAVAKVNEVVLKG